MPSITIKQGSRKYLLNWELIHQDKRIKQYKVWSVNNPDLFIILENNEPFIRVEKGLKHRRIDWKQIEGPKKSQATIDQIIKEIVNPSKPEKNINYSAPKYNRKAKPDDQRRLGDKIDDEN